MRNQLAKQVLPFSPPLVSGAYFAILAAVLSTSLVSVLYFLGIEQPIHPIKTIILAILIFGGCGALFGKKIILCDKEKRFKVFLQGFWLVIIALPLYDLFFFYFLQNSSHALSLEDTQHAILIYLFIWLYSFIFAGLWLAIGAGFAAFYLRHHLLKT